MTELASSSFPALGTTALIVAPHPEQAEQAAEITREMTDAFDLACSRFRDDSELSELHASGGLPISVSQLLFEALEVAVRAAKLTNGLVDPTVGTAMRTIGYDRDYALIPPDGSPIEVAFRPVPGWKLIDLNTAQRAVTIPAGIEIDLGATAKALCADKAAAKAARATGSPVLISLGGDIAISGSHLPGGWPVLVTDDHAAPSDAFGQTIVLHSGGLATSSTTVRSWRRGSKHLHHILDPKTGRSANVHWRTASVAARSCVDANIASCASIVMGFQALRWLEAQRLPARLVDPSGTVRTIAGWPADTTPLVGIP